MESIREVTLRKSQHIILDVVGIALEKYWLVAIKCEVGAVESYGGSIQVSEDKKHINRGSIKLHVNFHRRIADEIGRCSICAVEHLGRVGKNRTRAARLLIPGVLARIVIY